MNFDDLNPELDLLLDRVVDVSPDLVWRAWTEPEHVKAWFAPRPWTTPEISIDLRPGGAFRSVMRSPEGEEFTNVGCYLEIVEGRKLVWTDALEPGYRPSANPFFTAVVSMEPHEGGTRYRALARHRDIEGRKRHEEMGFHEGWAQVLDQLVEYANANLAAPAT